MKRKTLVKSLFLVTILSVLAMPEFHSTARAVEQAPPWLKECSYDAQGRPFSYTCDYVTKVDPCSTENC